MASAGLNCGQLQRLLEAQHLDAVAQHIQGAALVELIAQAGQERLTGLGAVVLGQDFPGFRLRRLHPGQHIGREERPRPVVARRIAFGIEPAVAAECWQISVSKLISLWIVIGELLVQS